MPELRQPLVNGALEPARLYIKTELQRIFGFDEAMSQVFDAKIAALDPPDQTYRTWKMVIALGASFGLNWVSYFLSNNMFSWTLEEVPLVQFVLTGINPEINKLTIQQAKQDPAKLYEIWKSEDWAKETLAQAHVRPKLEPGYPPLLSCEYDGDRFEGRLRVFDGMHRLLSAVIAGDSSIKAWVGRATNSAGKPFVSPELCYGLITAHTMSENTDPEYERAIKEVAAVLIDTYPNAAEVLELQVAGTKPDARIRTILGPLLDEKGHRVRN